MQNIGYLCGQSWSKTPPSTVPYTRFKDIILILLPVLNAIVDPKMNGSYQSTVRNILNGIRNLAMVRESLYTVPVSPHAGTTNFIPRSSVYVAIFVYRD